MPNPMVCGECKFYFSVNGKGECHATAPQAQGELEREGDKEERKLLVVWPIVYVNTLGCSAWVKKT